MAPSRVFIISDSLTFSSGLKSLLLSGVEVEITGEATDINQMLDEIDILKPDIIICGDSNLKNGALGKAVCLLRVRPGLKVIGLNLQNNEIIIYQSIQKIAQGTQDLVEAVKNNLFSPDPAAVW